MTVRAKDTGRVDYNLAKQIDEEWGHYATLVFIEKIGAVEKLCLRAPKSLIWHLAQVPNLFSAMDPFDDLAESCGPP